MKKQAWEQRYILGGSRWCKVELTGRRKITTGNPNYEWDLVEWEVAVPIAEGGPRWVGESYIQILDAVTVIVEDTNQT